VNKGRLMKRNQGLRSQPSDPIGEIDQRTEGIAGKQVAWEIIPQGGPAIQTMVSPRGYVSTSRELWGKKWVNPNRPCVALQIERHVVM
jgi:hypothetical protein